ncbi:MAG: hypothetical protein M3Y80_06160 [Verrucomicrobiota bacterium]|nr:hypothetical protein [Verrucomicrobiota bacterium]
MRRRSPQSGTPLTEKQQELAARERQLREQMEKLQQMIEQAPRVAEEQNRARREELITRASEERSRLDVSIGLHDMRDAEWVRPSGTRRQSLRKEQREGRIVFLVLVVVLAAAVLWLISHLRF